jgi:hypothetical protein
MGLHFEEEVKVERMRTGLALERQKAHESIELAKLATQLCNLNGGRHPQNYLEEALDLVHKANELIKEKHG